MGITLFCSHLTTVRSRMVADIKTRQIDLPTPHRPSSGTESTWCSWRHPATRVATVGHPDGRRLAMDGRKILGLGVVLASLAFAGVVFSQSATGKSPSGTVKGPAAAPPSRGFDNEIRQNAQTMLEAGRRTFRYDTFGD